MDEFDRGEVFVRVKDLSGEEFVCPLKALRNPQDLSPEELELCVDSATVDRYPGDLKIEGVKTDKKEDTI
ncbi:MAG: hypothetical protein HY892_14510 [Deltaproteobacteria bacterium]|nr:hypothetical protein [Deltaproteobacteria bacterium]